MKQLGQLVVGLGMNAGRWLRDLSHRMVLRVVMCAVLAACGGGSRNYRTPPPPEEDTSIGVGDVFQVEVIGEEELDGQYRVSRDGTIHFPYLGTVEVAGLEAPEVAQTLGQGLVAGGFFRNPQIRVFVSESTSKRFSVMGEVQSPGTFSVTSGLGVVEAISLAGGFTAMARQGNVRVTRRENGEARTYRVPVDDITSGTEPDFPLRAGDIVYVEQRPF